MSDSPASRPKRNSSIAAFYIDEDDFEVETSNRSGKNKTSVKEDFFTISENYEDSDSDVPEQVKNITDSKAKIKTKSKSEAKKNLHISEKRQAAPVKANAKLKNNSKAQLNNLEEDNFELIVDHNDADEDESAEASYKPTRVLEEDENFDENNRPAALKSKKPAVKKPSSSLTTTAQRPKPVTNRPKLPSTIEKVRIPGQFCGPRRVGLSKSAPTRPLSPVKLKKFD